VIPFLPDLYDSRRTLLKGILSALIGGMLFVSLLPVSLAQEPTLNIHFINVGYGDAILIELPDRRVILIDAGDEEYAASLGQYLASRNIKNLTAAVLTHPHQNHFGGFLSIVKKYPIGKFYLNGDVRADGTGYDALMRDIEKRKIPKVILKEKDEILLGDNETRLVVLHPSKVAGPVNDNSLVLWLIYKNTAFLLPADIQKPQQDRLLERYPSIKEANGVLVPHHGGPITGRFANTFGEDTLFVVSTGPKKNGNPSLERLDKLKGEIFRTDLDGTVILKSDGKAVEVLYGSYKK
jgi:competence protein ComEC